MKITISVADVQVNVNGIVSKAKNDRAFWTFAASEWHKLYEPYVPMDQGELQSKVVIRPKEIEHTTPYAHYQYMGIVYGPNYPIVENGKIVGYYSKGPKKPTGKKIQYKRPKASAKWDKAAAPTQLPKLASSLQAYVDSGRLKLD